MRLCHPQLRALGRGLAAASLLSGVMAVLWLVATAAVARIIDLHVAHQDLVALLPYAAVLGISLAGASLVQLARNTLLHRRAAWVAHGLSEFVLSHELWRASDARQRDRSLGAVAAVARFMAGSSAAALIDAPWAMLALGGLWLIDIDMAAAANVAALILLVMALTASRVTRLARQFDAEITARTAGYDVLHAGALAPDASLEQACAMASRWEMAQRMVVAKTYASAQARTRRQLLAWSILAGSACTMAWIAAQTQARGETAPGELVGAYLAAMATLAVLARATIDADCTAAARAALRHLATLRVPRTHKVDTRRPALASPDLRAPIVAAWLVAAASVAALSGAASYWNLPMLEMAHGLFAARPATRAHITDIDVPGPGEHTAKLLQSNRMDLPC